MKYTVHFLEPEQECAVMVSMALLLSTPAHLKVVWPQAEAKNGSFDPTDVEVVVVPLHRIGAPSGKSGAEVFVVYLRSVKQEAGSLPPSNALVVKLQKRPDKLVNEKAAADQWPNVSDGRGGFAKPMELYSVRGYTVLIAPFRAGVTPVPDEHRLKFQAVLDLYRTIVEGDKLPADSTPADAVAKGVREALELVAMAHQSDTNGESNRRQMRYSEMYEWYLRDTHVASKIAHQSMSRLFGAESEVHAFGENWPNPMEVLQRILKCHDSFEGVMGPAHGDLHPKNIIFNDEGHAHIIDFGWARSKMHVVVDYVLLDINLRAMTMASQVPERELLAAAQCLCESDSSDDVTDERLKERLKIIREQIWSRAISSNAVAADGERWVKEYLIPYFLVAYGLLVYLDEAQNQRAMLASVLAAAKRIHSELTP